MSRHPKKPRPFTYRDLREILAALMAATAILALFSWGLGFAAFPKTGLALAGALVVATAVSTWLRSLSEMDSAATEWIARSHPAAILSALLSVAILLGILLAVPFSGWSAWLALALPLGLSILVRSGLLLSEGDYRMLAGMSLASAALLTVYPGWGPRLAACAVAVLAVATTAAGHLWHRHRQGLLKGKVIRAEAAWHFGLPAAGALASLSLAFLLAPSMRSAWDPSRSQPIDRPVRIVVDWSGKNGGREGPNGSASNGESPVAGPDEPHTVVLRSPSALNLSAVLGTVLGLLRERGAYLLLAAAVGVPVGWGIWRLLKSRKALAKGENALQQVLDAARRRLRPEKKAPEVPDDPREAAIFLYNALRNELDRHGYKRQPHLAPLEYARYLEFRLSDEKARIARLTRIFEAAEYGRGNIPPEARRAMTEDCSRLSRRVRAGSTAA